MALDWSILQSSGPVDIAGNFARGYQMADTIISKIHEKNALGSLAQNPDDNNALAQLRQANPQLGAHFEQRQEARLKARREADDRQRAVSLGHLAVTDPAGAREGALDAGDFDLADKFGKLDDDQRAKAEKVWGSITPLAYQMRQMKDPQQRLALYQQARPILESYGADPQLLANFDPTNDTALDAVVSAGQKVSDLINQRKITWHQQGEQPSFATDDMGRPVGSANPYAGAGQPSPGAPQQGGVAMALSDGGLPANVVAGFLGNFHTEGGYGGASGDGGTASGIAQWRGDRQTNFARVIGKPVEQATPEEQAKFVLWEMQNPEAAGMTVAQRDQIMSAKTPGEAAELIDKFYERSSGEHRGRRVAAANSLSGGPVRVASKAEFDNLPSGTEFIAPDGSHRRKP